MSSIKSSVIFIVDTLIIDYKSSFWIFDWLQSVFFSDDKYISGARVAIVSMQYQWVHQQ